MMRDETVEWVEVSSRHRDVKIEWLKLLYFRSPAAFFLVLFFGGMVDWEFRVSMQAQQQVRLELQVKVVVVADERNQRIEIILK